MFVIDVGRNRNIAIKIWRFFLIFARVLHFLSQSTILEFINWYSDSEDSTT